MRTKYQATQGNPVEIDIGKIMREIEKRSGPAEILSFKHSGINIRNNVKLMVDMEELQLVAAEIHRTADPSKLSRKPVHRGQGMTQAGINNLIKIRNEGTPVEATHFLSCDRTLEVAKTFVDRYQPGERAVLFQIWGYSNVRLRPNLKVRDEDETVFAPGAKFLVKKMGESPLTGNIVVHLEEIAQTSKAVPLPY